MLVLEYLAIQGFKVFVKDSMLTFGDAGFYLLTGDNRVEPRISPNGAGKSTVWDALSWVFFGKTVRGLKGKDVNNWKGDTLTSVFVRFTVRGRRYEINRTQTPNSLTLAKEGGEPEVVAQEKIDELIGFNHVSFLSVALMGQFNKTFFDLAPADKLAVFSEAMDLSFWLRASKAAAERGVAADQKLHRADDYLQQATGDAESLRRSIVDLADRVSQWAKQQAEDLDAAEHEESRLAGALEKVDAAGDAAKKDVAAKETALKNWQTRVTEIAKDRAAAHGKVDEFERMKDTARLQRDAVKKQIATVQALAGECPTCKHKVTAKHVEDVVGTLEANIVFIATEWEHQKPAYEKAVRRADNLDVEFREATGGAERADAAVRAARRASADAEASVATARARADAARDATRRLKATENPLEATLAANRKRLGEAETAVEKHTAEKNAAAESVAAYKNLADRFKEVRLWIIDEALAEFELEVNNSLLQLGLDGWSVKFDIERENTSGGVTKGFTVLVTSPASDEPAAWAAWSGGETQRLRIAGAIGLANLITKRRGTGCNLEVWDEPTQHLNEGGIADLLAYFQGRSRDEDKQIWLVDHRSLHHGGFDGITTVVRTEAGASITKGKPQ